MSTAQVIALLGGTLVAAAVKVSNVLIAGLAKLLGVNPPAPIPDPENEDPDPTPPGGTPETA